MSHLLIKILTRREVINDLDEFKEKSDSLLLIELQLIFMIVKIRYFQEI